MSALHVHFGQPHSGYHDFHTLMAKHMLASTALDDVGVFDEHLLAADGDVFILMVHDRQLCAWMQTLRDHPDADRAQQVRVAQTTVQHRDYDPATYAAALGRRFGITVPADPIGGIFFTRTPDKKIVMVLVWDRLAHNLPIVEFVLDVALDRWQFGSMRHTKARHERAARDLLASMAHTGKKKSCRQ